MSYVDVLAVEVVDENPADYTADMKFKITFQCRQKTKEGQKLLYVLVPCPWSGKGLSRAALGDFHHQVPHPIRHAIPGHTHYQVLKQSRANEIGFRVEGSLLRPVAHNRNQRPICFPTAAGLRTRRTDCILSSLTKFGVGKLLVWIGVVRDAESHKLRQTKSPKVSRISHFMGSPSRLGVVLVPMIFLTRFYHRSRLEDHVGRLCKGRKF